MNAKKKTSQVACKILEQLPRDGHFTTEEDLKKIGFAGKIFHFD